MHGAGWHSMAPSMPARRGGNPSGGHPAQLSHFAVTSTQVCICGRPLRPSTSCNLLAPWGLKTVDGWRCALCANSPGSWRAAEEHQSSAKPVVVDSTSRRNRFPTPLLSIRPRGRRHLRSENRDVAGDDFLSGPLPSKACFTTGSRFAMTLNVYSTSSGHAARAEHAFTSALTPGTGARPPW